ncbi:MAG: hypothetical protein R8G66_31250 [Cytophagales bacterium]|nr:hypothetical protein [Cytophagales bacterium]
MSSIRLTEKEQWNFKVDKAELLSGIDKLTGSTIWHNAKRKEKINLYVGELTDDGFYIRENPNIARKTSISGRINRTRFSGKLESDSGGTTVEVTANREDLYVFGPVVSPIFIGIIIILSLKDYLLYQLTVGLITLVLELLIIRGINAEIREGMAKLKKKLGEIEKAHSNDW